MVCIALFSRPGWAGNVSLYKQRARVLFREGKALALRKSYAAAIEKYQKAIQIIKMAIKRSNVSEEKKGLEKSHATFLYIVGRTYQFDGKYLKALKFYRMCLVVGPKPKVEEQAKRFLMLVLGKVQVTLVIKSSPARATLSLYRNQGESRFGKTPFFARLEPGRLLVKVSSPGYETKKEWLELRQGTRVERMYRLRKRDAQARQAPRRVVRRVRKRASLRVSRRAARRVSTRSGWSGAKVRKKRLSPRSSGGVMKALAWTSTGIALSGAAVGGVLIGMAASGFASVSSKKGNPLYETQLLKNELDRATGQQTIGVVAFSVAGVGAVAAIVLFLQSRKRSSLSASSVSSRKQIRRVLYVTGVTP